MVNGMVGIVLGVAFFLIGLGKASVSKNAEANAAFVKKYGRFFFDRWTDNRFGWSRNASANSIVTARAVSRSDGRWSQQVDGPVVRH